MNTAVATNERRDVAPRKPLQELGEQVKSMNEKFAAALPAHIPVERFSRFALLALSKPEMSKVAQTYEGQRSVVEALLKGAADGLLPDGRESALVAYDMKVKTPDGEIWVKVAQYQPMVAGIMKKARNSGEIASIVCQVVYEKDDFHIDFVTDGPPISHRPALKDRGDMVGVYALCRFRDGTWSQPEWMTKEQVDGIRARSKSRKKDGTIVGPWASDYSEMARKTVIRRASKSWPSSTDSDALLQTIRADDDLHDTETIHHAAIPSDRKTTQAAALLGTAPPDDADDDQGGEGGFDDDEDDDIGV